MYICQRFKLGDNHRVIKILIRILLKYRKCRKERFSHQKEREETNMVLWKEWPLLMVEKYWLAEEQKGGRKFQFHLNPDQKNND